MRRPPGLKKLLYVYVTPILEITSKLLHLTLILQQTFYEIVLCRIEKEKDKCFLLIIVLESDRISVRNSY